MPENVVKQIHAKTEQAAPIASPEELGDYDAIIFGTPTRFGNMAGQMRNFLDQTGGLWAQGKLIGKVERAGYSLVPLDLHFSKGRIKLEFGLAKGKRQFEKRASEADKDWKREQNRLLKQRSR